MADMTELLRLLAESVACVAPASGFTAWLLDPTTQELSLAYATESASASTMTCKLSDTRLSRQAVETGIARSGAAEVVNAPDPILDPGSGPALAVRLGPPGQPLGLFIVQVRATHTLTFTQETTLQALGELGSVALVAARRAAELERAEASRVQFMHITTHELRSPLAVSQTLIRNVVKGYAGQLTDKQRDVFRRISGQLDALEGLINDLLDLAASRSSSAASESVLLNASVGRAVLLLQPRAEEKSVELQFRPCREELVVHATDDGLDRIFVNLVGNAIKYTPPAGRVTVSLNREGEKVAVTVADTGIGIPPEGLAHLFEEFYRAPNARAANIPGTGLGLAIVKELVQRFGGQIRVDSTAGIGTIFTVSFPLDR